MSDDERVYVIYEAQVVFTVNLEDGAVSAEVSAPTLNHVDTGLSFKPSSADQWPRLHRLARALVELAPERAPLRWERN